VVCAMNILIISIDHFVQCVETGHENTLLRERKDRLETLLRGEIPARNVQFIAEEVHPHYGTIAQQLGNAYNPFGGDRGRLPRRYSPSSLRLCFP